MTNEPTAAFLIGCAYASLALELVLELGLGLGCDSGAGVVLLMINRQGRDKIVVVVHCA